MHTHRFNPYLNKACAAGVAAVWLFSRVDASVSLQVGRSVELGAAHVTAVRLLTCRGQRSASLVFKEKKENRKDIFLFKASPELTVLVP